MNEEIDESEFYHQDFTTASEWEIFIARFEEIIHEWKVESNKGEINESKQSTKWEVRTENLPFADVDFTLTLYKNKSSTNENSSDEDDLKTKNPIDTCYDFILHDETFNYPDSKLAVWYGLDEFIVLSPINNHAIVTESKIKILLSSLHIVAGNINCEIPMFVQIRDKWQNCYLGVYEGNGLRTNFEMVHLRRGPQHCQYLTGLVDLFKTKIMSPLSIDPIIVSVQLTYSLSDFGNYVWKQDLADCDSDNFDASTLVILPLGVTVDPINNILLKATWSQLPDNLIVDSENYSNFDPMQAPKWTTIIKFTEQPICLLTDCLTEFFHLLNNSSTVYDVLGDFATSPSPEPNNPLDLLTESKVPTISSVLKRAARNSLTRSRKGVAPLSDEVLVPMLYFMFPDAEDESKHPYFDANKQNGNGESKKFEEKFRGFKTCKMDSLVWRVAIVLAQALHTHGGNRALAHVWFEFVQEMRYRWEKSISIPGLSPGFPDARTCLLHQKLQMLNCCIERKRSRESAAAQKSGDATQDEDSDDEEFFDCSPEKSEDERNREKHSLWNQPVGRLGKFENLKLLQTGDALYIPITQDPVPKTEDQLEEDTDILLKLGSDATGSELRARMMSASLLSDMESFKAANPGSILEDFIRWYSPRDWIEEDEVDEWGQRKGHLSSRMLISDNTWVDMWKSAKPVPANRQKRLFDDTREAEKVLHFLDSRGLSQVSEMLLAVLAHAAICRIMEEFEANSVELPDSTDTLQHLIKAIERVSREGKVSTRRLELFLQEMSALELSLSQANSLMYKFNPSGCVDENISGFVGELIRGREVEIKDKTESNVGDRLVSMFTESQKAANLILIEQQGGSDAGSPPVFPQAAEREFIMRVSAHRPAAYSSKSPQLLRAILSKNEFRLAGAFSEDIVFF